MPKIVIAEDDKLISGSLVQGFTGAGFDATPAYDGEEALAKIREIKPDVIILDIMMPKYRDTDLSEQLYQAVIQSRLPKLSKNAHSSAQRAAQEMNAIINQIYNPVMLCPSHIWEYHVPRTEVVIVKTAFCH